MTPRPRVEPPTPAAGRVLAWQHALEEHDRQLHDGARRQREHRDALAARRDDDDSDAA
jgi:hypothetical protein